MKNDYHPIGDMSYQEWRNIVDTREDIIGSGIIQISFRDKPNNLEYLVIGWYKEMLLRGDQIFSREYVKFFNLVIENK